MVITAPRQSDTIEKLLKLAEGNRELVHEAIKASEDRRSGQADLEKVVEYIKKNRLNRRAA